MKSKEFFTETTQLNELSDAERTRLNALNVLGKKMQEVGAALRVAPEPENQKKLRAQLSQLAAQRAKIEAGKSAGDPASLAPSAAYPRFEGEEVTEALIGKGSQMARYTHPDIEAAAQKKKADKNSDNFKKGNVKANWGDKTTAKTVDEAFANPGSGSGNDGTGAAKQEREDKKWAKDREKRRAAEQKKKKAKEFKDAAATGNPRDFANEGIGSALKKAGKYLKRGAQGWGGPVASTPKDLRSKSSKGTDSEITSMNNFTKGAPKNSPAGVQHRAGKLELAKRKRIPDPAMSPEHIRTESSNDYNDTTGKPYGVQYKVFAGKEDRLVTKQAFFKTQAALERACEKIENLGNFYQIDGCSYPKNAQVAEDAGGQFWYGVCDKKGYNVHTSQDLEDARAYVKAYPHEKLRITKHKKHDFSKPVTNEGWIKSGANSQERIRHNNNGVRVRTPEGEGTIWSEHKIPTFSQMVPFVHQVMVNLDDGQTRSFRANLVKKIKAKPVAESSRDEQEVIPYRRGFTIVRRKELSGPEWRIHQTNVGYIDRADSVKEAKQKIDIIASQLNRYNNNVVEDATGGASCSGSVAGVTSSLFTPIIKRTKSKTKKAK